MKSSAVSSKEFPRISDSAIPPAKYSKISYTVIRIHHTFMAMSREKTAVGAG